jgi:predicted membrane-bound spermidine synthase
MGCIGLAGFALVFWIWLPRAGMIQTFVLAGLVWMTLGAGVWFLRKGHVLRKRDVAKTPKP